MLRTEARSAHPDAIKTNYIKLKMLQGKSQSQCASLMPAYFVGFEENQHTFVDDKNVVMIQTFSRKTCKM